MTAEEYVIGVLRQTGELTADQHHILQAEQKVRQQSLTELCVRMRVCSPERIAQLQAQALGVKYIDLLATEIDWALALRFGVELQRRHKFFVFTQTSGALCIAMADIEDIVARDAAAQRAAVLGFFQIDFFQTPALQLQAIQTQAEHHKIESSSGSYLAEGAPANEIIDSLLQEAALEEASDIHFQPEAHMVVVRYRSDGLLRIAHSLQKQVWPSVAVRLKILSELDIAESRRPQSGHFETEISGQRYDIRVSTHPTVDGENIVLRLLCAKKRIRPLAELGFPEETVKELTSIIAQPYGLFLICGPTGSGKTTTLYALCAQMDAISRNIMTLEEPVEYRLNNIRQTEVQMNGVVSFADGVRSILRQDPDVILIGEIRDEATAKIALRAAMTGHLVLATVHANTAELVPARLVDLGVRPGLLAGQILAVLSQRLVRCICAECSGSGCESCWQTGLRGRTAVSELCVVDAALDAAIAAGQTASALCSIRQSQGRQTLQQDGESKVHQGLTTWAELQRALGNLRSYAPKSPRPHD